MKRIYFPIFVAAAVAAVVSCQKDALQDADTQVSTLTAAAAGVELKSELTDGKHSYWSVGDAITVFDANKNGVTFNTAISAASATADFTYEGTFATPDTYWAFYPAGTVATDDFATFTGLEVPAVQTATVGGYDPAAALAYASSETSVLKFHHLTALVKFTVADDEIYTVKLVAEGDKLAGTATMAAGKLTATGSAQVVLKGGMFKGNTYYIAVAPGTFSSLKVYVNGVELAGKSYTDRTLSAGTIYNMGEITNPRESVAGYVTESKTVTTSFSEDEIQSVIPSYEEILYPCSIVSDTYNHGSGMHIFKMDDDGYTMTSYNQDGTEYVWTKTAYEGTWRNDTDKGQHYGILYDYYAQPLYFDIDWETLYNDEAGKYAIVNPQDRYGNHNTVILNNSYYDSNTKTVVIDFVAKESPKVKIFLLSLVKGTVAE